MTTVRLELPAHLCLLAGVRREVQLSLEGAVTQRTVLDELEAQFPMLQGTLRDQASRQRRPFIRFFACEEDLSHASMDDPLPEAVAEGREPLLIVGAIAGG
jgi:molybdopterin synthase sulfur carrier subunit